MRPRIALVFTGLSWVLPFLSPNFREPIATFYGEAGPIVLGLAAVTFLYGRSSWPIVRIPRASLVFLGFAALILAHLAIGRTVYPQQNLLAILYLVWAVAMAALGWRLREIFGIGTLITVLAWCVLGGALLSAAVGLAQWWGIPSPLQPFTLPQVHGRIYANTGQPNHLADYICLGIASLIFLSSSGRLRLPIAAVMIVPLIVVLVVSGSKSVLFYLGAMLVLGVIYQLLRPSRDGVRVTWLSAVTLGGFVLAQSLIGLADNVAATQVQSIALRTQTEGLFPAIRIRLWYEAWLMFQDAPLLGQGFRQFPWQHFMLNAQLPPPRLQDIVYDNAHSLLFHTGAEFGLAGLLVLTAGIWTWAKAFAKREFSALTWWMLSAVAILGIHSMLEYPLWYAYFLGIAAVLLGASESAAITIGRQTGGRLVPALILLLGWTATANTYLDYRTLQSLHRIQSRDVGADGKNTTAVLLELRQHSLFTPFVDLALARLIALNQERLEDKLTVNGSAMHFAPDADVVYRQALLLSLAGREQAARAQWDRSVMNYPGSQTGVIAVLEAVASNDSKAEGLLNYAKASRAGE